MARQATPANIQELYADLEKVFSLSKYDFTPTVVTPITQHNGIDITGTFNFNDHSTERVGPTCYVTVRRDTTDPYPQNGLGFAFTRMDHLDTSSGIFNIYLVDNSSLIENVFLYNQSILQENGVNNFLAANSRQLKIDTSYRFKLRIDEFNG
ncbi:MAG: hypothetical protein KDH96_11840, partial [Candidatus Riesia sp.]|nr:hypothetical protein [Candidatus Riesia sp.]